jgi:2-polyprenyl-3-methyl-5-hydroxy-6-metoxy-1,4-benzoquinol methylase
VTPAPCPACGGDRFADWTVADGLTEHTCLGCGLLISSIQRTGPVVPEFALVDERAYLASVGAARRRQATALLRMLAPVAPPGRQLLDVGCSFGFFLEVAGQAGYAGTGIEPDPQARAYAQALLGDGAVRAGTLSPDTAADASAEVVATLDVVEHLEPADHGSFTAEFRRVLAPGGVWLIKVPSTEGLYYRASRLAARVAPSVGAVFMRRLWQTAYEHPHTVYFDRRSLAAWLQRHGFSPVAWRYLPEVPPGTAVDRLSTDGGIRRWQAWLLAPAVHTVTAIDWLRRRSDALAVLATPR